MAQVTNYAVGNGTGLSVRKNINNVISAITSQNSGASEPIAQFAGMEWWDTSNSRIYRLKKRNMSNDGWQIILEYDVSSKKFIAVAADSLKLGGLGAGQYALKTELAANTAADSLKLGGINASEYALKSKISDGLKIGSYLLWSSEAVTPAGFLVCDGRSLSKTEYAELFAVIGYTYGGSGKGFNIPNFSDGKFFRSVGGNAAALGTAQTDAIRNITAKMTYNIGETSSQLSGAFKQTSYVNRAAANSTPYLGVGALEFDASLVVPTANENRPYNMSVVVLIKAKDVKEPTNGQIDESIYATEVKAGITKLKNSITGNSKDVAVTEKAVKDFMDNGFSSLKAANGYTKLPNGLMMQWGTAPNIPNARNNKITFPIAFENACVGVWFCADSTQHAATATSNITGKTNTSFVFNGFLGVTTNLTWLAIGY